MLTVRTGSPAADNVLSRSSASKKPVPTIADPPHPPGQSIGDNPKNASSFTGTDGFTHFSIQVTSFTPDDLSAVCPAHLTSDFSLELNDPFTKRDHAGLRSVYGIEFSTGILDVPLNRSLADLENFPDLPSGLA